MGDTDRAAVDSRRLPRRHCGEPAPGRWSRPLAAPGMLASREIAPRRSRSSHPIRRSGAAPALAPAAQPSGRRAWGREPSFSDSSDRGSSQPSCRGNGAPTVSGDVRVAAHGIGGRSARASCLSPSRRGVAGRRLRPAFRLPGVAAHRPRRLTERRAGPDAPGLGGRGFDRRPGSRPADRPCRRGRRHRARAGRKHPGFGSSRRDPRPRPGRAGWRHALRHRSDAAVANGRRADRCHPRGRGLRRVRAPDRLPRPVDPLQAGRAIPCARPSRRRPRSSRTRRRCPPPSISGPRHQSHCDRKPAASLVCPARGP